MEFKKKLNSILYFVYLCVETKQPGLYFHGYVFECYVLFSAIDQFNSY